MIIVKKAVTLYFRKEDFMEKDWWKKAVVYQVYPKSFQDSNADGIGDIRGIINHLDYLEDLGITALWLNPMYCSPGIDNGYDISDYEQIDPIYGSMKDMQLLIDEARKRGIKIIMDLVVNHTSDKHPWFIKSRQDRTNKYRDYYVWRDPVDGHEPNELQSTFGGSAWEFDSQTGQYYLHQFSKQQPDLNWQNSKLRQAIYKMMNFWIEKGIGGFRLDVIDLIGKNPDTMQMANGKDLHRFLQEMNQQTFGGKNLMTVGETWGATPEIAKLYSDSQRHELSMVFQFEHTQLDQQDGQGKWSIKPIDSGELKKVLNKWQVDLNKTGWNSLFWNNHDLPRAVSAFGNDREYRTESAKMLAILLHLMKGTPYIYQGEEIGMTNCPVSSIDEVNDVESINMYYEKKNRGISDKEIIQLINYRGRDNARTPMQWKGDQKYAGFSSQKPWLHVNPNYKTINVDDQLRDSNSIYNTYKELIDYRKKHLLVVEGSYSLVDTADDVYAYLREMDGQKLLVVANLSGKNQDLKLDYGIQQPWISNYNVEKINLDDYKLRPYEAFAVEIH